MSNKTNCCDPKSCYENVAGEYIVCPTCNNKITDMTLVRCPRCYGTLLKFGCGGNCSRCGAK